MRGEYGFRTKAEAEAWELPPRARRIHTIAEWAASDNGTTSACAENTFAPLRDLSPARNYLRVRGEYRLRAGRAGPTLELPPRARRIPTFHGGYSREDGTTSACAENTGHQTKSRNGGRNYLRVRGEYLGWRVRGCVGLELPPRARRIRQVCLGVIRQPGTTSACAENTQKSPSPWRRIRNYLRVRGEY